MISRALLRDGLWTLGCILYVGDFMSTDSRHCRHVGNPTLIELANFDDNEGHVVGEGTVPPRSHAVEDRLLHIREC